MDRVTPNQSQEAPLFQQLKDALEKIVFETEAYIGQINGKVATIGVHPIEMNRTNDHNSAKSPTVVKDQPHNVVSDLWEIHYKMRSNVDHLHLINEALSKLVGN